MTGKARLGREGNRWLNERPTPEEFADWFWSQRLHDEGMSHDDFFGGLALLQDTEKCDEVVGFEDDGRPKILADVSHVVYSPYANAVTRQRYFDRYMDLHPEWLGMVEPFYGPGQKSHGLPPHFFSYRAQAGEREIGYLGCSMRVVIYERHSVDYHDVVETGPDGTPFLRSVARGKIVRAYPPGSKGVPVMSGVYDPDHHALSKAETGAIGRALGWAGMLAFTGVSTAEEMQEALAYRARAAASPETATLPPDPAMPGVDIGDDTDALRARAKALLAELEANFPKALEQFQGWARDRKFGPLEEVSGPNLKAVVKKLERTLDDARLAVEA